MSGKRSDPGKLARERDAIAKSKAELEPKESIPSLIGKIFVQKLKKKRKGSGYGSPPQVPGAMQHGFRDVNKDT